MIANTAQPTEENLAEQQNNNASAELTDAIAKAGTTELLQNDGTDAELLKKMETAGDLHFVFGDKVYTPKYPKIIIPHLGERTALEICVDEEAQEFLVKNCADSLLTEIN